MSKTTERRTVLSVTEGEKITRVNISDDGTSVEIFSTLNYQEETDQEDVKGTQENIEKNFPGVEESTLLLEDEFLKYKPENKSQREFEEKLISALKSESTDF